MWSPQPWGAAVSDEASDPMESELARLDARLAAGLRRKAGFPGAADID